MLNDILLCILLVHVFAQTKIPLTKLSSFGCCLWFECLSLAFCAVDKTLYIPLWCRLQIIIIILMWRIIVYVVYFSLCALEIRIQSYDNCMSWSKHSLIFIGDFKMYFCSWWLVHGVRVCLMHQWCQGVLDNPLIH